MKLPSVYAGKILVVNLTEGKTEVLDTAPYAERFLGGRGIATKLYWDLVPPEAAAFDGENCLIAAVGPMAGLPAIGGSRWGLFGKSPFPEGARFCYGNLGGYFGAELKFAGFDALVVRGKAPELSVLVVRGNGKPGERPGVEVVPAMEFGEKGLAGMAADKTIETVKNESDTYGKRRRGKRQQRSNPPGNGHRPRRREPGAHCYSLRRRRRQLRRRNGGGNGLEKPQGRGGPSGWCGLETSEGVRAARGEPGVDRERLKAIEQEIRGYGPGEREGLGAGFYGPRGEHEESSPATAAWLNASGSNTPRRTVKAASICVSPASSTCPTPGATTTKRTTFPFSRTVSATSTAWIRGKSRR